jgi:aspartyl-tRNA(Asn)/glutamyl-tRNA(Gln) amidotransferase subunit B
MDYEITIGLEVHVQLKTRSKMFCGCSTAYGAPPNTQVCPVCLGYPGAMPTMNREAIRLTVLTGLMVGSTIPEASKFDRKSYFYPDMPKNYQISQYDRPLCVGGSVEIDVDGARRSIGITRIHLEEDVAKNTHFGAWSGVDFNRAGVPLMEIVSEPELRSPDEAFAYLLALKQILRYVDVSACNLEEGNVRCDVNCSVRPPGRKTLGTKTELKNLNTFKGVLNALRHEAERQMAVLREGGTIRQETRRWDADTGTTTAMRSKEYAHDYRYFPEPDLMPVVTTPGQVESWRRELPELPARRRERFQADYGLPAYDAGVLAADRAIADFFEAAARLSPNPKAVSNWIMTETLRSLSESGRSIDGVPLKPEALAALVKLVDERVVSATAAKEVFAALFAEGGDPAEIVRRKGLVQVSDSGEIERLADTVIGEQAKSVEDYRAGRTQALQFLVGQVMRLSRGKANPQLARDVLTRKLG